MNQSQEKEVKIMTNQKHNESEDFDPGQSSTRAVDGGGIGSADPPEEDNDSELLFRAISQLQTVRVPGKGKLNVNEAIAAAISQGDAFSRWCERGTPVGEIDVWVEERRVMSVLPQSPAELQEFTFKVPSPDTAVLQLTTSEDGEKTVLYNLRLRDVPPEGLSHTEAWPNGQCMSLNITCRAFKVTAAGSSLSGSGRLEEFCIRIAINPQAVESASPTTIDGSTHERAATVTGEDHSATDKKPKAMAARAASFGATRFVVVAALLILSPILIGGLSGAFSTPPCETGGTSQAVSSLPELAQTKIGATTALAGVDLARTTSDPLPESRAKNGGAKPKLLKTTVDVQSSALNPSIARKSNSTVATHHTAPKEASSRAPVAFENASLSPWQVSVYPKLAALKNVHVKLDSKDAETARMENLRVSFVRLWEASERFKVLSDTDQSPVDGVISLRFESAEPCLGVVFLNVNGPDGKFLWQDFAWEAPQGCRALPEASQPNLFSDASIALVNRLKTTIRLAQESTKRTELFAAGD
jgi:hypothetical protein